MRVKNRDDYYRAYRLLRVLRTRSLALASDYSDASASVQSDAYEMHLRYEALAQRWPFCNLIKPSPVVLPLHERKRDPEIPY